MVMGLIILFAFYMWSKGTNGNQWKEKTMYIINIFNKKRTQIISKENILHFNIMEIF